MSEVGSCRRVNVLSRASAGASTFAGHQLNRATTCTSGRPSFFALILQAAKELGDPLDRNPSKATEVEKVAVATDDHFGSCSHGALQNPVVSRVSLDHFNALGRLDGSRDDTQLPVRFSNPLGHALELVPEDAKGLRDDGVGNDKVDLTIGGEVEELSRLASELQCADQDVGVSDDALYERVRDSWTACSTTASTSASLMSPRR